MGFFFVDLDVQITNTLTCSQKRVELHILREWIWGSFPSAARSRMNHNFLRIEVGKKKHVENMD